MSPTLSSFKRWGFPGGPVVKNPLANAGEWFDPWSWKIPDAVGQLSLGALEPVLHKRSHSNGKHWFDPCLVGSHMPGGN